MMDNVLDSDTIHDFLTISITFHQTNTNYPSTHVFSSGVRLDLSNNMSQFNDKLIKLLGRSLLSENGGPHSLDLGITTPIIGAPMAKASGGMDHGASWAFVHPYS